MSSSGSVKMRYENCLGIWGNAKEMEKPGVPVDGMLRKVRKEVVRLAKSVGHDQVPALYDQTVGEFYLNPK
jgi:hypothetical protein